MKFSVKNWVVEAYLFTGTAESVTEAQGWISQNDITDCEVGSQGKQEPYALDITGDTTGILVVEAPSYLYIWNDRIQYLPEATFLRMFEEVK